MKTIHLLRHAKASGGEEGQRDHDRPLDPRGARAAELIGDWLERHRVRPDLLLCSSAQRAVATLDGLRVAWRATPEVELDEELYLASAAAMLERLRELDESVSSAFLIAHNPGMHELAAAFASEGEPAALQALGRDYPTAALTVIDFESETWPEVGPRQGTLVHYTTPTMLT